MKYNNNKNTHTAGWRVVSIVARRLHVDHHTNVFKLRICEHGDNNKNRCGCVCVCVCVCVCAEAYNQSNAF